MKVKLNKFFLSGTMAQVSVRNHKEFDTVCRAALAAGLKLWINHNYVITTAYPLYAKTFDVRGSRTKIAKFIEHSKTAVFGKVYMNIDDITGAITAYKGI